LYGVYFKGNRDLRRIITNYGFKGHPLRKEFPLTGFCDISYYDEEKKVASELIELAQQFRIFSLQNEWNRQDRDKEIYV
jgi:NADH-quinone oxidoreductase subunit C